jgi:hypothetical protein
LVLDAISGLSPWPVLVADRDWFHPPPDRFFRIQAVLQSGGYTTFDLG